VLEAKREPEFQMGLDQFLTSFFIEFHNLTQCGELVVVLVQLAFHLLLFLHLV